MDSHISISPLLSVRGLTKSYWRRSWIGGAGTEVRAVRGVDFELSAGKTIAIVGASGSGKSTLARCLAGLDQPTSGEIVWHGERLLHRHVQLIFQDPGASFNPGFSVAEALQEALTIRGERDSRIGERMRQVGLPDTLADQRTSQLSGGQKARLALARALAALSDSGPAVLILDESLGSLDLSVQAQMINLLVDLQEQRGLAYILITHELRLAAHMADEVAVMSEGLWGKQSHLQPAIHPAPAQPARKPAAGKIARPTIILRRLAQIILLLAGISVLSFVLLDLAPGDFLGEAKLNPRLSAQTIAALREQYGLNKSLPQKYAHWLGSVAKGDFGVSFAYNLPVSTLLWPRALKTLALTVPALILSWLIALPLGLWSAAHRRGWLDRVVNFAVAALLAVPELVLACIALLIAARFGAIRSGNPLLPITVLVLGALPILVRHTRAAILSVAQEPFARAARANGISGWKLWFRWLLPAAANPLASLFGLSVAGLISSSLLVEVILGWPGLGPLFLEAIGARDFYLVIGPVMLSAGFLAIGTLLGDILLYMVDPRIRMES